MAQAVRKVVVWLRSVGGVVVLADVVEVVVVLAVIVVIYMHINVDQSHDSLALFSFRRC